MEIITLRINKHTKAGKAFLQVLEYFTKNTKGVEIDKTHTQADLKPKVLNTFKKTDLGKDLKSFENVDELFADLES